MTEKEFKDLALSFPGTIDNPHFKRTAFKIVGKRIFATLDEESASANIYLPLSDQEIFCKINKSVHPVANKWGAQGWTTFELNKISGELALDALETAYKNICNSKKK